VTLAKAKSVARFALEHRLATLAPLTEYVEAGVLLSLGTSLSTQRRGAARYVSRILSGSAPGDLPVENAQPKLVINEKTLQSLRLPLPVSFQVRIDEVL
jgi:putative ABC transport system substrate-binding protein